MDTTKKQALVSILMDSPLYLTIPLKERLALLARLTENYPSLLKSKESDNDEETEVGYEASWSGIF